MNIQLDAGARSNVEGNYIQPSPWEARRREALSADADWGSDVGSSNEPMFMSSDLGRLMINDCYRKPSFVKR